MQAFLFFTGRRFLPFFGNMEEKMAHRKSSVAGAAHPISQIS